MTSGFFSQGKTQNNKYISKSSKVFRLAQVEMSKSKLYTSPLASLMSAHVGIMYVTLRLEIELSCVW